MALLASPAFAQSPEAKRPGLLIPLYASNLALHALDVHSTKLSLHAGNREGNPVFKDASIGTMRAVKVGASAATMLLAEKLWKRNRAAAVGAMIVTNVGLSAAIASNYRLSQRSRPGS